MSDFAESVFETNMTSLLNVAGSLKHNKDDGNVLDAELSTYVDEKNGFYHLNGFWRPGLIFDILVSLLKFLNDYKIQIPFHFLSYRLTE